MPRYCIVIPHYNHERQFLDFLPKLMSNDLSCIVVDDGSSRESLAAIKSVIDENQSIYLVEQKINRGKGAAVRTGLTFARSLGFSHAIQIDADGQHNIEDLHNFIRASEAKPSSFICGKPVFDITAPKVRLYGRKVTDFWVAVETLSLKIKDGLCGFRVYPLTEVEQVFDAYYIGPRMDFDTEILVKASWLNLDIDFIDTAVVYPENNVSHFKYLRDNLLLIKLHLRLLAGMILRLPWIFYRRICGRTA